MNRESALTCKNCGSDNVIKKGKRINKYKEVSVFLCKRCNKKFSFQNFNNKTYDIVTIAETLSCYNCGHTIDFVAEKTNIPRSTISNWQSEYSELFGMTKYFKEIQKFRKKVAVIQEVKINYPGKVVLKKNLFKIKNFVPEKETEILEYLDIEERGQFLDELFSNCDVKAKEFKVSFPFELIAKSSNGTACQFAKIASEYKELEIHEAVQKIMLENDTKTIATSVPVFMKISSSGIPWLRNIKSNNSYIIGNIDILQYVDNKFNILCFSEDEPTENSFGNLLLCACCLSDATGIPLRRMELICFDQNFYYQIKASQAYKFV
ncbi:MAG: hypothetical protein KKD31_12815 [Bacteroidetes bacterium]|nr:hypothetical protein [Bacteroidota bacterium]